MVLATFFRRQPETNDSQIEALIDALAPSPRTTLPRVIQQTPAALSHVKKGTKVTLVLAPLEVVKVGVFKGTHTALKEKSVADLAPVLEDPKVREVLETYEDPADVPVELRNHVSGVVAEQYGIQINNTPGQDFPAVFNALAAGMSFA